MNTRNPSTAKSCIMLGLSFFLWTSLALADGASRIRITSSLKKPDLPKFDEIDSRIEDIATIKVVKSLFDNKEYGRAIGLLQNREEKNGRTGETAFVLGVVRQAAGQHDEAIADFSSAISLGFRVEFGHVFRGDSQFAIGSHDDALDDYASAIALAPKSPVGYQNRARFYYLTGQSRKAREDLDIALQRVQHPAAYTLRAVCNLDLGDVDAAALDATSAIELSPNESTLFVIRASAHVKLGRPQKALDDFDAAIRLGPKANLYVGRGMLHLKTKNFEEAARDATAAIQLNPRYSQAYRLRAAADVAVMKILEKRQSTGSDES